MIARAKYVNRLLLLVWVIILAWQVFEHVRVRESARSAVRSRARVISKTTGLIIRSQRWFVMVQKDRLESAMKELLKSEGLTSVALLNAAGKVLIAAGTPIDFSPNNAQRTDERWEKKLVTMVNRVDLGTSFQPDGSNAPPTIVIEGGPGGGRRENPPRFPPDGRPRRPEPTNTLETAMTGTNASTNGAATDAGTNAAAPRERDRRFQDRPGFGRGPRLTEEEMKTLAEEQGLHDLALVLSTASYQAACVYDLWLRLIISGFAAVSVIGFGLAWRNLITSSEYQMRLIRASEMNSNLREMNVAAAGLAHETRNPLNIIRGLAQMISKAPDAPEEVRGKSRQITDEVDRVTVQLNEYINYSKPREVRRSPVAIDTVISDVVNTLKSDLEDKGIQLQLTQENLTVNADQQLLRQVVFNVLLNAIQAVPKNGQIQIGARKSGPKEACFEVRDNGPGVPVEQRQDIFRPYFTTRDQGTGLGLAVVKQIVMAHGWDVECLGNNGPGAIIRISRLELMGSSGS